MEEKILIKKQLKLSLPIGFENFIVTLMSLIDAIVVANLGVSYLTAIGAIGVILNILQIFPQSLSVSNIALLTKNEDKNIQKKYLEQTLNLGFFSLFFVLLLLYLFHLSSLKFLM